MSEQAHQGSVPTSRIQASCGRIVHIYSTLWQGPRPADVLSATNLDEVEQNKVRCNVKVDGQVDADVLARFRAAETGNTLLCHLYDPLTDEQRAELLGEPDDENPRFIAEWMPYQKGQAQKNDELTPRLKAVEQFLENSTSFKPA
jgi:hypothetical protein